MTPSLQDFSDNGAMPSKMLKERYDKVAVILQHAEDVGAEQLLPPPLARSHLLFCLPN